MMGGVLEPMNIIIKISDLSAIREITYYKLSFSSVPCNLAHTPRNDGEIFGEMQIRSDVEDKRIQVSFPTPI
jgi:hypothetical protein